MLLELENINKTYSNKVILDRVSFGILENSINVLIGPNGAGKTTLARIILGLEQQSSGKVKQKKGMRISYVPQSFNPSFNIPITASDFIKSLGLNANELTEYFDRSSLQFHDAMQTSIHELSGGYIQNLLLAIAFAQKPDLLVLDEPTANLDVDAQEHFYQIIKSQKEKNRFSVLIISHDLHMVMKDADQVFCLNHHLCCTGIPFKTQEKLESNIGIYRHNHDHKHH